MTDEQIDPATYGERWAEIYDDIHAEASPSAVALLADLAHGGRALELGIGTGRFALPLAAKGVAVEGIDLSESMVARLRAKPGGEAIPVTIGDFAEVGRPGPFDLIFVVFNTFYVLLDQPTQVRCFSNVAERLKPDGAFVIEAFVPDLARFQRNQWLSVGEVGLDRVRLDAARHDPVAQRVTNQIIFLSERFNRYASHTDPVRVAVGTRPDGKTRRPALARALVGLEPIAVRRVQQPARLGLCPRRPGCIAPSVSARGPRRERSAVGRRSSSSRGAARWRLICLRGPPLRGYAAPGGRRAAPPRHPQCSRPDG